MITQSEERRLAEGIVFARTRWRAQGRRGRGGALEVSCRPAPRRPVPERGRRRWTPRQQLTLVAAGFTRRRDRAAERRRGPRREPSSRFRRQRRMSPGLDRSRWSSRRVSRSTVPDVAGRPAVEATNILGQAGLQPSTGGGGIDAVVPTGRVIRTDPPAGPGAEGRRHGRRVVVPDPAGSSHPDVRPHPATRADHLDDQGRLPGRRSTRSAGARGGPGRDVPANRPARPTPRPPRPTVTTPSSPASRRLTRGRRSSQPSRRERVSSPGRDRRR